MAKRVSSEELKRKHEALRARMIEDARREKELKAEIKKAEQEERDQRLLQAGSALERECKKLKVDLVFDEGQATMIAAMIAEHGLGEGGEER